MLTWIVAAAAGVVAVVGTWFLELDAPMVRLKNSIAQVETVSPKETWWKKAVIYHVYVRSFQDSNGDGIGDLPGLISRLDYLNDGTPRSLGVDAVWLSPINPSPQKDFGYDVADYYGIDPVYGTMSDFETLLKECKRRNIRVITDLVVNHTSDKHPWFIESRASKDNPKRDWYLWKEGRGGNPPNNWRSRVDESAWTLDEKTSEYYLHSFFKEQPDLNWRNQEVQDEVTRTMRYWLDKGVSGFRLDIANYYFKDEQFRDNPLNSKALTRFFYGYDGQHHLYDKDLPDVIRIFKKMRQVANGYDAVLLGEIDSDENAKNSGKYHGDHDDGLSLTLNFDWTWASFDAKSFVKIVDEWKAAFPKDAQPLYALSNHDRSRHFTRFGNDESKARLAALMMMTLRGTPILYYGEEIGMRDASVSLQETQDPLPLSLGWFAQQGAPSRDICRSPMQWTPHAYAGFSSHQPWMKMADQYETTNVDLEEKNPNSLLHFYRHLLWLRKQVPVLQMGEQLLLTRGEDNLMAYKRVLNGREAWVLLNFSSYDIKVDLSAAPKGLQCLTDTKGSCVERAVTSPLLLAPYEGVVLITSLVAGAPVNSERDIRPGFRPG